MSSLVRAAALTARQEQADKRALDLAPIVKELRESGAVALQATAAGLDQRGILAVRGGSWSANQIARLRENIASPFANAGASTASAGLA
jgi:hypothetical protein